MNAANTQNNAAPLACHPAGSDAGAITASPMTGNIRWPNTPIIAQATHERIVKPTTHGLRRRRTSEIAPRNGIDTTTSAEATALAAACIVFETPRSLTSHTVKYSVCL